MAMSTIITAYFYHPGQSSGILMVVFARIIAQQQILSVIHHETTPRSPFSWLEDMLRRPAVRKYIITHVSTAFSECPVHLIHPFSSASRLFLFFIFFCTSPTPLATCGGLGISRQVSLTLRMRSVH